MTASLALVASLLWGSSDFLGGRLSRGLPSRLVVLWSQLLSTVVLAGALAVTGGPRHGTAAVGLGAVAGLLWVTGLAALYRALAGGAAGVVAPIASCGMIVPVLAGIALGDRPGALQLGGVVAAGAGVVCCSGPGRTGAAGASRRPLLLAALTALAFGTEITLLSRPGPDGGPAAVLTTLTVMRAVAVLAVGLATLGSGPIGVPRADLPALALLGGLDVAATAAFLLAARDGATSLVAVLASLYPAVTVLLARGVGGERLRPVQGLGVLATIAGAACIAGGGTAA